MKAIGRSVFKLALFRDRLHGIGRVTLVLGLVLASLSCSLPFLSNDTVEFSALETSAQATGIARLTQEVLSGAAATAIVQSLNATNQALTSQPPTAAILPSPTGAVQPADPGATAAAAAQATAIAQTIRITSEAQSTQSALVATLTALGPGQPPPQQPPPQPPPAQVPVLGRFTFPPGATSSQTGGELPRNIVVDYLIAAQGGQTLLASVYSPGNNVYLGVSGVADGMALQRTAAGQTSFTGALPATQDYRLTLAAPAQKTSFTLQVIIPARIQFAPGADSASIPGQLGAGQTNYYLANARGGQTMTVRILSPNNDIFLTIYGMTDGSPLVRSVMAQTTWTGTLPITQDYMIQAVSTGQAAAYTLEIAIR